VRVCVCEREKEREREGHLGVNKGIVERLVLDLALLDALQRLRNLLGRRGGDLRDTEVYEPMCSGSEAGSYVRLIDLCITQL